MVNGQSMSTAQGQDNSTSQLVNQRDTKTHNDIMIRRMKNRERQRRYRARKRLEADTKKSSISDQSPPPVEKQMNGVISNYTPRVHCKRNWKKDARRAHILEGPEVTPNGYVSPSVVSNRESQTSLSSGTKAEAPFERESHPDVSTNLVGCETHKAKSGRRNWKADARKKKV